MDNKKRNKKKLLGILNLILGIGLICFGFFASKPKPTGEAVLLQPKIITASSTDTKEGTSIITKKTETAVAQSSINLSVNGKTLVINFSQGDTLEKIIKEADSKNTIDIKGTNFSGLGFFVNEINGVKAGNGYSWIYYINGVKATVGVSSYVLQNKDLIEWRYEKNY